MIHYSRTYHQFDPAPIVRENHGSRQGIEDDVPVWRYMDLAKFINLLDTKCLYFPSASTFFSTDPFEGSYARRNIEWMKSKAEQLSPEQAQEVRDLDGEYNRSLLFRTYINCWHIAEHESMAMWGLYADNGRGLAIRSSYKRLVDEIKQSTSRTKKARELDLYIGNIEYIDYETEKMNLDVIRKFPNAAPFFYKRTAFQHERELRIGLMDYRSMNPASSISLKIDLSALIDRIVIYPKTYPLFADAVKSIGRKFGVGKLVANSDLLGEGYF